MTPDIVEGVLLAVTGLLAGLCGGLLGIGGSIIMIPAMTELMGVHQHLYQAAALMVNFFVAVPALRQHVRAKAVAGSLLWKLIPGAMVAAILGVACSELSIFRGANTVYLAALFGVFLFYIAGYDILRMMSRARRHEHAAGESRPVNDFWAALLVAVPAGFVSGLLGVGGGIVAVPLQRRILHLPLRTAIANSAAMIVGLSLVGTAMKHYAISVNHPEYGLYDPVRLAIFLIPTAIIGASIGGRLTHVLPLKWVRIAFVLLMLVAGARMTIRALG